MHEEYLALYIEKMQAMDPIYLGGTALVAILFLGIIISAFNKMGKKSSARKVAPNIIVKQLQVAPLGKGVQLKLENKGEIARVIDVKVLKRDDIIITQAYKDFIFEKDKIYQIFFEAEGRNRADNGFDMLLEYADSLGNAYKQQIHVEKERNQADKPKLVKLV